MFNVILHGYRNTFNFNGRERRRSFLIFMLVHLAVLAAMVPILSELPPVANFLFVMVWYVPLISFLVRRLHDINLGGWWVLPGCLILFVFVVLMLFAEPSAEEEANNRFGPNPRTIS